MKKAKMIGGESVELFNARGALLMLMEKRASYGAGTPRPLRGASLLAFLALKNSHNSEFSEEDRIAVLQAAHRDLFSV